MSLSYCQAHMQIDYAKTRDDAMRRKQELLERQRQIAADIKRLSEEDDCIRREIIGLEQVLDGLEFMISDVPPDLEPLGFTDHIRKVLALTTVPLLPTQIRDSLLAVGIAGSSPRNLLINVHTVLRRINDELEEVTTAEGKTAYISKRRAPVPQGYGAVNSLANMLSKRTLNTLEIDPPPRRPRRELVIPPPTPPNRGPGRG